MEDQDKNVIESKTKLNPLPNLGEDSGAITENELEALQKEQAPTFWH